MFDFSVRIGRKAYLLRSVTTFTLVVGVALLLRIQPVHPIATAVMIAFAAVVYIATFYLVCLVRQRANDIGKHPLLITLLAIMLPAAWLVIGAIPGQPKANRYGPVPKPGD